MSLDVEADCDSKRQKWRSDDVKTEEDANFSCLLLPDRIQLGLKRCGFEKPSPVQLQAIPLGRCGIDLVVQAKSGTGKTCVMAVIALSTVVVELPNTQVLILAPTREIAFQISGVIQEIGYAFPNLTCETFIGGIPLKSDKAKLPFCQIVVGTPGRIKQLIDMEILQTASIRLFAVDEADRLFDKNFKEDTNWIFSSLPSRKQILALSATYPDELSKFLSLYLELPAYVRINSEDPALLGVIQCFRSTPFHPMLQISDSSKFDVLLEVLNSITFSQCMIFCLRQTKAQDLADNLVLNGFPSLAICSNLDQTRRLEIIQDLKSFQIRVLVSTDLTARGIDAENVDLVINFEMPYDPETYLHRIGRAGRYGTRGMSISLASEGAEMERLKRFRKKFLFKIYELPDPIPVDLWDTFMNLQSKLGEENGHVSSDSNDIDKTCGLNSTAHENSTLINKSKQSDTTTDNSRKNVDNTVCCGNNTMECNEAVVLNGSFVSADLGKTEIIVNETRQISKENKAEKICESEVDNPDNSSSTDQVEYQKPSSPTSVDLEDSECKSEAISGQGKETIQSKVASLLQKWEKYFCGNEGNADVSDKDVSDIVESLLSTSDARDSKSSFSYSELVNSWKSRSDLSMTDPINHSPQMSTSCSTDVPRAQLDVLEKYIYQRKHKFFSRVKEICEMVSEAASRERKISIEAPSNIAVSDENLNALSSCDDDQPSSQSVSTSKSKSIISHETSDLNQDDELLKNGSTSDSIIITTEDQGCCEVDATGKESDDVVSECVNTCKKSGAISPYTSAIEPCEEIDSTVNNRFIPFRRNKSVGQVKTNLSSDNAKPNSDTLSQPSPPPYLTEAVYDSVTCGLKYSKIVSLPPLPSDLPRNNSPVTKMDNASASISNKKPVVKNQGVKKKVRGIPKKHQQKYKESSLNSARVSGVESSVSNKYDVVEENYLPFPAYQETETEKSKKNFHFNNVSVSQEVSEKRQRVDRKKKSRETTGRQQRNKYDSPNNRETETNSGNAEPNTASFSNSGMNGYCSPCVAFASHYVCCCRLPGVQQSDSYYHSPAPLPQDVSEKKHRVERKKKRRETRGHQQTNERDSRNNRETETNSGSTEQNTATASFSNSSMDGYCSPCVAFAPQYTCCCRLPHVQQSNSYYQSPAPFQNVYPHYYYQKFLEQWYYIQELTYSYHRHMCYL